EVEHVLTQMTGIEEAAVVGKKDDKWGQVPFAYIVTNASVSETEIMRFLKEKLAHFKVPHAYYFVDAFPKTASHKVKRHQLSKQSNHMEVLMMDKQTYFVDFQSLEISSQEVKRNHGLEIYATEAEKLSLEETMQEM